MAMKYIYRCQRCGAQHETTTQVDSVYCECAWRQIEVVLVDQVEQAAPAVRTIEQVERELLSWREFNATCQEDYEHACERVRVLTAERAQLQVEHVERVYDDLTQVEQVDEALDDEQVDEDDLPGFYGFWTRYHSRTWGR